MRMNWCGYDLVLCPFADLTETQKYSLSQTYLFCGSCSSWCLTVLCLPCLSTWAYHLCYHLTVWCLTVSLYYFIMMFEMSSQLYSHKLQLYFLLPLLKHRDTHLAFDSFCLVGKDWYCFPQVIGQQFLHISSTMERKYECTTG